MGKPRIAVHKFASCDGCQLAFLNLGEPLLAIAELVDIVHFAEAGPFEPEAEVDLAFIEGSITTPHDAQRIRGIRERSRMVVSIGACATAGGLQALRNLADADAWMAGVYSTPAYIETLATSTPIANHIHVDFELWGCPINGRQVIAVIQALLLGVSPLPDRDHACLECKRAGHVCVMVARGEPCMGPVTQTGCGALCPAVGRGCYGCYGPAEQVNGVSLGRRFSGLGLLPEAIARRFSSINSAAPRFAEQARHWSEQHD